MQRPQSAAAFPNEAAVQHIEKTLSNNTPASNGVAQDANASQKSAEPSKNWDHVDGFSHLVASGKTFRVYRYGGNSTNNLRYVVLELLTIYGWVELRKTYCGDIYYGFIRDYQVELRSFKLYAEHLVAIGATVSGAP